MKLILSWPGRSEDAGNLLIASEPKTRVLVRLQPEPGDRTVERYRVTADGELLEQHRDREDYSIFAGFDATPHRFWTKQIRVECRDGARDAATHPEADAAALLYVAAPSSRAVAKLFIALGLALLAIAAWCANVQSTESVRGVLAIGSTVATPIAAWIALSLAPPARRWLFDLRVALALFALALGLMLYAGCSATFVVNHSPQTIEMDSNGLRVALEPGASALLARGTHPVDDGDLCVASSFDETSKCDRAERARLGDLWLGAIFTLERQQIACADSGLTGTLKEQWLGLGSCARSTTIELVRTRGPGLTEKVRPFATNPGDEDFIHLFVTLVPSEPPRQPLTLTMRGADYISEVEATIAAARDTPILTPTRYWTGSVNVAVTSGDFSVGTLACPPIEPRYPGQRLSAYVLRASAHVQSLRFDYNDAVSMWRAMAPEHAFPLILCRAEPAYDFASARVPRPRFGELALSVGFAPHLEWRVQLGSLAPATLYIQDHRHQPIGVAECSGNPTELRAMRVDGLPKSSFQMIGNGASSWTPAHSEVGRKEAWFFWCAEPTDPPTTIDLGAEARDLTGGANGVVKVADPHLHQCYVDQARGVAVDKPKTDCMPLSVTVCLPGDPACAEKVRDWLDARYLRSCKITSLLCPPTRTL